MTVVLVSVEEDLFPSRRRLVPIRCHFRVRVPSLQHPSRLPAGPGLPNCSLHISRPLRCDQTDSSTVDRTGLPEGPAWASSSSMVSMVIGRCRMCFAAGGEGTFMMEAAPSGWGWGGARGGGTGQGAGPPIAEASFCFPFLLVFLPICTVECSQRSNTAILVEDDARSTRAK